MTRKELDQENEDRISSSSFSRVQTGSAFFVSLSISMKTGYHDVLRVKWENQFAEIGYLKIPFNTWVLPSVWFLSASLFGVFVFEDLQMMTGCIMHDS
jgi:hypothetical protein